MGSKGRCCAGGEEYAKYKQQVVDLLKAGQLVVQMMAAEETISMPDGSRKATFTQDTWDMACITNLVTKGLKCIASCQQAVACLAEVLHGRRQGRGGGLVQGSGPSCVLTCAAQPN